MWIGIQIHQEAVLLLSENKRKILTYPKKISQQKVHISLGNISKIMMDTIVDIGLGLDPQEFVKKINTNITDWNVMEIVMNYLVNLQGNIAELIVNSNSKRLLVMMKWINYIVNTTEYPEAGVCLNLD